MAWNQPESKALQGAERKAAQIPAGAPVALNPSMVGRPYRDGWDIERAYREGMQKVTWVYRCVDAIAGNQARLPVVLREDNAFDGEIVTKSSASEVIDLLNTKANDGENSFAFRYRISSQLLLSTRGVFIEKVRGRNGALVALHLLPPQYTSPIPDPKTFVSGFEVRLPAGGTKTLRPENVLWIRRPHPLDPYRSITPMESAGVAIEIENLAKLYNRNFLLNDGRPGGLLVVRGEMDDDDKDELRSRFRGNLNRSGSISVISSDDGVDFVDTGASPRDAAYTEMRNITKEEILSAFGVPETAIGNAAGRTFSNASEELRVFWMETMLPHLHTLARSLDELDEKYYVDFDTSTVPIIVLYKQERERFLMNEFQAGLISGNEYRTGTGRSIVKSDLMDSLLANPNLTPIGNTEKKMETGGPPGQPVDQAGVPGAPTPGQFPGMTATQPAAPAEASPTQTPAAEPTPAQQAGLRVGEMAFKSEQEAKVEDEFDIKADQTVDRWTEIMDRGLERFFERQQRVILEKANGAKTKKSISSGTLTVENLFDADVWNKQMADDMKPIITAIVREAADNAQQQTGATIEVPDQVVDSYADEQVKRIQEANSTTKAEIAGAVLASLALKDDEENSHALLKAALLAIFIHLLTKRKRVIAEHESQSAYNAGVWFSAKELESNALAVGDSDIANGPMERFRNLQKTWITRRDSHVRAAHKYLHGKSVPIEDGFVVGGEVLRFPGDPLAPPSLTINCRCKLRIR